MKKSILTILILLPILTFAQDLPKITGLLGIPFGSSVEKVKQVMTNKGAKRDLKSKQLLFTNVKFGAYSDCLVIFSFVNNKLYQGIISLPSGSEGSTIDRYDLAVSELSKKYGEGESYKSFKYPYEEGDGHELTAIQLEKAEFTTYWIIGDQALSSYISKDLYIFIKYQDTKLFREASQIRDTKNLSDY